jgi:hypothetical protein
MIGKGKPMRLWREGVSVSMQIEAVAIDLVRGGHEATLVALAIYSVFSVCLSMPEA